MRLIDADVELKKLDEMEIEGATFVTAVSFAKLVLLSAPTASTQSIVRCKNCKYWDESDIHSTVNPNCRCRAVVRKNYTDSEFYCAYGERKDGEQNGTD